MKPDALASEVDYTEVSPRPVLLWVDHAVTCNLALLLV